jgi:hypothetical protein
MTEPIFYKSFSTRADAEQCVYQLAISGRNASCAYDPRSDSWVVYIYV